jgi:hypothetical protein
MRHESSALIYPRVENLKRGEFPKMSIEVLDDPITEIIDPPLPPAEFEIAVIEKQPCEIVYQQFKRRIQQYESIFILKDLLSQSEAARICFERRAGQADEQVKMARQVRRLAEFRIAQLSTAYPTNKGGRPSETSLGDQEGFMTRTKFLREAGFKKSQIEQFSLISRIPYQTAIDAIESDDPPKSMAAFAALVKCDSEEEEEDPATDAKIQVDKFVHRYLKEKKEIQRRQTALDEEVKANISTIDVPLAIKGFLTRNSKDKGVLPRVSVMFPDTLLEAIVFAEQSGDDGLVQWLRNFHDHLKSGLAKGRH